MKIRLDEREQSRLSHLQIIKEQNKNVIECYSAYLNQCSDFITEEMISDLTGSCGVTEEYAFYVVLAAMFGLDIDGKVAHARIGEQYLLPSVHRLNVRKYQENPYYKRIHFPCVKDGEWEMKWDSYKPYEGFVCNDLVVMEDYSEIPQLGFFPDEFAYPVVLEAGVEWMTVTPNEIETMQPVIDKVEGNVLTLGLGLGYFAYMAARKTEVKTVTVVEKEEQVIRLFEKYLLPQFEEKEKIKLIHMDALDYLTIGMEHVHYDYVFADLWHDVSDGVDWYLRIKKYEYKYQNTIFFYWIETSLLSVLRSELFWSLEDEWEQKKGASDILNALPDIEISSVDQILDWMSDAFLKKYAEKLIRQ